MNKINGYTEEEAKNLVEYIKEGKSRGKTLTYLFESYGKQRGRAKGSVRNYYYALMKNERGDERIVRLLEGSALKVEKIKEFTPQETDEAIRDILREKSKGTSVRRAIHTLAQGDDKLMLRLQNKYRNTLKKDPARIATIAKELGLCEEAEEVRARAARASVRRNVSQARPSLPDKDVLRARLESEIDALYERLAQTLKTENERLRRENELLKSQLRMR